MTTARKIAAGLALMALAGCHFYDVTQTNVFSDDDGYLVRVDYGRASREHVNTFIAPNGKEMEFKSRLVVRVELPDGDDFTAWQCMNFQRTGTMYKTDNGKWKFLANGFSCVVYRQSEKDERRYLEVYRGVICETPDNDDIKKKDERWRNMKKDASGKWR